VPRKNIRLLDGKPLLLYTIEAAQKSRLSKVVVSTEDEEIAEIARHAGCEVIARPAELAQDQTPTLPVIQHAVHIVEEASDRLVDYIVILQVTTPFRNQSDIDEVLNQIINTGADSVVSVCQLTEFHPWKVKKIVNERVVPYSDMEIEGTRRQDLPPAYIRNGGIYAVTRDTLMSRNSLYGTDCRAYVMPRERSVDINDELDFLIAETIIAGKML